jgi:hypothetical protein
MKMRVLMAGMAALSVAGAVYAQERGYWNAASSTAKSITGDLSFGPDKITINFSTFTLAQIRELKPEEKQALFPDAGAGAGNLYRVQIPSDKKFLRKNSLCGGEETDWVVTWVSGKELDVAMFSGGSIPSLTAEGLASGQRMCGTFTYTK